MVVFAVRINRNSDMEESDSFGGIDGIKRGCKIKGAGQAILNLPNYALHFKNLEPYGATRRDEK